MKNVLVLTLALLINWTASALAEDGLMVRTSTVYAKASGVSDQVGSIEAGSKVSIFERQGGWKLIFSDQRSLTGWVRSYQVRTGGYATNPKVSTETDSRGFLGGLASFSRMASSFFSSSGSDANNRTATIGVRGLSEEEIKAAVPDFDELEKMHQFASNLDRLSSFSDDGQLTPRQVTYLREVNLDKDEKKK